MHINISHFKTGFSASLCVALTAITVAGCGNSSGGSSGSSAPINIVVTAPYTGASGTYGQYIDDAFQVALQQYGAKVGNRPIRIIKADTQCTPSVAVQALHQALASKPVAAVSACSGDTLALEPTFDSEHIPDVTTSFSPQVMANHPSYVWDVGAQLSQISTPLASEIRSQGAKTLGIVSDTSGYGVGVSGAMSQAAKSAGLSVTAQATFQFTDTDYSGPLLRMKNAGVQALFVEGYAQQLADVVKQARQLGLNMPIYTSMDIYDQVAFSAGGSSLNGVVFASPYITNDSDASKQFASSWEKLFGDAPLVDIETLYEAVTTLVKAVHEAGANPTSDSIVHALDSLTVPLPTGSLSFSSSHQRATATVYLGKVDNNSAELIKTIGG